MSGNQALAARFQAAVEARPETRKSAFRRLQVVDQEYVGRLETYRKEELVKRPHRISVGGLQSQVPVASAESQVSLSEARVSSSEAVEFSFAKVLRWVVAATAAVLVFGFLGWMFSPATWDGPVDTVQVSAGESLWTVASDLHIDSMTEDELVQTIIDLNGLSNSTIQPGQTLIVPAS